MAVYQIDGTYWIVEPVNGLDARRAITRTYPGPRRGPYPGWHRLQPDRSYIVGLDPSAWPVAEHARVTTPDGTVLDVLGTPLPRLLGDPAGPSRMVAYVRLQCRVIGAQQDPETT